MEEKACAKCKSVKSLVMFYADITRKDGFSYQCKACDAAMKRPVNAKYHEKKRVKINAGRRKRYWENRERELASMRRWREANSEKYNAVERERHRIDPRKNMLANAKARAKRRGIPFDLNLEDIFIPEICPVLGVRFVVGTKTSHQFSPALDRINNLKGYVKGNVIVVTHKVNTIKNNASSEELLLIASFYSSLKTRKDAA